MKKIFTKKKIIRMALQSGLAAIFVMAASLAGIYLYLNPKLPDVESLNQIELQFSC